MILHRSAGGRVRGVTRHPAVAPRNDLEEVSDRDFVEGNVGQKIRSRAGKTQGHAHPREPRLSGEGIESPVPDAVLYLGLLAGSDRNRGMRSASGKRAPRSSFPVAERSVADRAVNRVCAAPGGA